MEAHYEIYHNGTSREFAPQQIVSCTPDPHKCGGYGLIGAVMVQHITLANQDGATNYEMHTADDRTSVCRLGVNNWVHELFRIGRFVRDVTM